MKAIVQERFGPPDVLQLVDTDPPEAGAGDVLVRVHAAALNPYDWHIMRGDPLIARPMGEVGLTKPKARVAGIDAAGRFKGSARTCADCGAATRCSASAGARSPSTRSRRQARWCPSRRA
jgi:threonine dehydrogenase-like Zn-dependent dehydrogenase